MNATLRTIITSPPPIILPSIKPSVAAWYDAKKYMGMNNAVTAKWYDASSNGRNAAMSNLAWTAGSTLSTNGFEVDGIDDFGVIADSAETRLTTGGTLMAWIYPKSLGELLAGYIIDKSTTTGATNGYLFSNYVDNALKLRINDGTATLSTSNAITLNRWQRVVATFNSSGRHLYVNGVDVTASGGSETALPPNVVGDVYVGNRAGATDRTFDGYIDKAAIITRALTPSEIWKDFQNSRRQYGV
jgi:hypothetical protein